MINLSFTTLIKKMNYYNNKLYNNNNCMLLKFYDLIYKILQKYNMY